MTTQLPYDLVNELKQPNIERPVQRIYELFFDGIIAQICANGGNSDDGADIFQESVLVLVDKVKSGQFRGEASVKTFLSSIARNLWLFELRTRHRRKKRERISTPAHTSHEQSEVRLFDKTHNTKLEEVLDEIGAVCKRILIGFYYEQKSMRDLLTELNYENEQVIRNKKSKCMKNLKTLLTNNQELFEHLKIQHLYEY